MFGIMDWLLLSSVLISFILTVISLPIWIRACRKIGLTWEDMNKFDHPKNLAASGGIVVMMSFILGVLFYIALKTFLYGGQARSLEIFALLTVVLILGIVALVDDMLGWKHGGLPMRIRLGLAVAASIPLVVINAGTHVMDFPFLGMVDFGIIYPLILIPLAIVACSTVFNMLEGHNGLGAGQGILILSFLSFVSYYTGSAWLGVVGLCMVGALAGFWIFNKVPAQVLPGDVLTYSVGAMIGCMAILGNFEKIAFIVFLPYVAEVVLKVRGGVRVHSFGKPQKDGTLKMFYGKVYGLTNFAIYVLGKRATEKKVVYFIHVIQIIFILIASFVLVR